MGKWWYNGDRRQWVYIESCSICSTSLKRRDWNYNAYWEDIANIEGSPNNWYIQDFTYAHGVVTWAIRCWDCGGDARPSGRGQGPGPHTGLQWIQG